uniref:Fucosyltransferase n=2 Tax=Noccaea caerulescens TaxID=107243 RepID=A0A1J3JJ98_NOCCA
MYHIFQISGEAIRSLGLKMKILITVIFSGLLIWSIILLSFPKNFNDQLLDATNYDSKRSETPRDKLIGGLLTADFDERSCVSRYHQSLLYRNPSPYKPSEYLVSKLRRYEKLHKRCGPGTDAYKEATKNLGHDDHENYANKSVGECKYIVWVAVYGLGNRILTLASVFLYALLTDRVVLVDQSKDISDLFCEPFPDTSWLLPHDFPLTKQQIDGYHRGYSRCYGTMLINHAINSTLIPPNLYLDIVHDSRDEDKMFFCPKDRTLIDKVPWLIVKANVYFVPSLWFNPTFRDELTKMFPQKETIFHHLARYLFHPTNQVWGMVTRYYNAHLARADERLGLQIRVFSHQNVYFQHVMDQVVSCAQREKLLPELSTQEDAKVNTSTNQRLKAVLVTSLFPEYSDNLKNMFWERPSSTGEIIEVYQPSGERFQQTDKKLHDQKALAEMYLLSYTDKIVTSARSTFGYVAHSLGGLKPWLLYQPRGKTPDPPCVRATSMEPCFLTPPTHGCGAKKRIGSAKVVPFVRHCEDLRHDGLKLFDDTKDEL